jgi:hypothetical protein
MSIEKRFLQKAIEDRNLISFTYEGESYKSVRPLIMSDEKITCNVGNFEIGKIKKLIVLKERF